jgi:hypothetical protein
MAEIPTTDVDAYREQIIAWLARKERKWRETCKVATGAASDAASFYAAAYSHAIQGILDREPEKRSAMEACLTASRLCLAT